MRGLILVSCLCTLSTCLAMDENTRRSTDEVAVVEPAVVEPNFLSRIIGEETQARIAESVSTWANQKAKENPGCVERFVCETYKTGETMSGLAYLFMSLTNAAVSFIVAEQFSEAIPMEAITRAARYGRTTGTCHRMDCPVLEGQQLRTVTDYLAGLEEVLGYIIDSISTSLG